MTALKKRFETIVYILFFKANAYFHCFPLFSQFTLRRAFTKIISFNLGKYTWELRTLHISISIMTRLYSKSCWVILCRNTPLHCNMLRMLITNSLLYSIRYKNLQIILPVNCLTNRCIEHFLQIHWIIEIKYLKTKLVCEISW